MIRATSSGAPLDTPPPSTAMPDLPIRFFRSLGSRNSGAARFGSAPGVFGSTPFPAHELTPGSDALAASVLSACNLPGSAVDKTGGEHGVGDLPWHGRGALFPGRWRPRGLDLLRQRRRQTAPPSAACCKARSLGDSL